MESGLTGRSSECPFASRLQVHRLRPRSSRAAHFHRSPSSVRRRSRSMNLKHRRLFFVGIAVLATIYIGSFAVLAFFGGYMALPSGRFRPFGLASPDTLIWQPRYGMFYAYRDAGGDRSHVADALGYVYSPLICITQLFIRPSIRFLLGDGSRPVPRPPFPSRHEFHPEVQRVFARLDREHPISPEAPTSPNEPK